MEAPARDPQVRHPVAALDRAVEAGRGALFIGFAKVFFMVSGFLQKLLLTRLVGQAEYGAFSVVNVAISIVNNTMVQATVQSVSKFTAEDDAQADAVKRAGLTMQAFLATAIGLGFLLGAPIIAGFLKAPAYVSWFRLVAAIPFLYGFYAVFVGSANGLRRFRAQASFDVGFSTAKTILLLGGAMAGAAAGRSVTGAFLGFVSAAALILIVSARVMGLPKGAGRFPISRLLIFMAGVVSYTALINVALSYDLMLLRRFAGAAVADTLRAEALAGTYEAVRNLALLPYQALLVITFVIFPLVSRSTFVADKDATKAYVTQTLRYALILASAMGVVLGARPLTLLGVLYPPAYAEGARALPVLVAGICCLALLAVSGAIINASGRPRVAVLLVATTVLVGGGFAVAWVPSATPGPDMLFAAALATSLGMLAGVVGAFGYLRWRFEAGPPPATVLRTVGSAGLAIGAGRLVPGAGKVMGLLALATVGVVFVAALVLLREFGPADRAKFRKILRR